MWFFIISILSPFKKKNPTDKRRERKRTQAWQEKWTLQVTGKGEILKPGDMVLNVSKQTH